jgi:hypothetical protein
MKYNNNDLYYTFSNDGKIEWLPWTTFNNSIIPNEVKHKIILEHHFKITL